MAYDCRLCELPGQPTAVIRARAARAALADVIRAGCGEVWSWVSARPELQGSGNMLVVYHDVADGTLLDSPAGVPLEIGTTVGATFAGTDRIVCASLPGGRLATTVHRGEYGGLGRAHEALVAWCRQQGLPRTGLAWELYGHWDDDPAKLRTDVFHQLR